MEVPPRLKSYFFDFLGALFLRGIAVFGKFSHRFIDAFGITADVFSAYTVAGRTSFIAVPTN